MTHSRPLALTAAAALGLGSLIIAAPAMAEPAPVTLDQESAEAAAEAFIAHTGTDVVSIGDGVIVADKSDKTAKVIDFAARAEAGKVPGVDRVLFSEPFEAFATTDVVGGAGYFHDGGACSVGFAAWTPDGWPALFSAGHCTIDGTVEDLELSLPSEDPAVGGDGFVSDGHGVAGQYGFSQYGGPGHTTGAEGDADSIDISVIDLTNRSLLALPRVTDWTTADDNDLAASSTPIKRLAAPVSGSVSKSGRTSGLTSGSTTITVEDAQGNPVQGEMLDGWANIGGRYVHGFASSVFGDHGDSGGAVFQGDAAVGVVSGGNEDILWATRLQDDIGYTGGYTLAVDIDTPTVASPESGATVAPGAAITVTLPENATSLRSVLDDDVQSDVDSATGTVELTAPDTEGDHEYRLTAYAGYSQGQTLIFPITVADILEPATASDVTVVASGTQGETADVTITGSGRPGATVQVVNGEGEARVAEDGTWSLPSAEYPIGVHDVRVVQQLGEKTSSETLVRVTVSPAAAVITSIEDGQEFAAAQAPRSLSGTGIPGATITASIDEESYGAEGGILVNSEGEWVFDLTARLGSGAHVATVTQQVAGVTSAEARVDFVVAEAPVAPGPDPTTPPTTPPTSPPTTPGGVVPAPEQPTSPQPAATPGAKTPGSLAITGGELLVPFGVSALVMLLVGGGALALVARRMRASEEA